MAQRITQAPLEVLIKVDAKQRLTQAPLEVLLKVDAKQRVTQAALEVLIDTNSVPATGGSQVVICG